MKLVFLDFETFWSQDYSLSKMSFIEYCHDPRFEVISCSIAVDDEEPDCVFGHEAVRERLAKIDWSTHAMVAHNGAEFDFYVAFHAYDIVAALYIDTLCMARPKHQSDVGGSLAKLSKHYGLPDKNAAVLHQTRGRRLKDFTEAEIAQMAVYNPGDTRNCRSLYRIFLPDTPPMELLAMDLTVRMILDAKFVADRPLLETTLVEVKKRKAEALQKLIWMLGCNTQEEVETVLQSSAKFADVLRALGVNPPTKISKKTKKETYALAKTDQAFLDLQEHPDERVQLLCSTRLGVKSTILETRLEAMLDLSGMCEGNLPVTTAYHSATTGRWGGRIWNPTNLIRIDPKAKKITDALRMGLKAPPGHVIVVSDLSGIELRVNHWLWEVPLTAQLYAADPKADLYTAAAMRDFRLPAEEITKAMRQLKKVEALGLGFGSGALTFKRIAKTMGGITLTDEEAQNSVNNWRSSNSEIVKGWRSCQYAVHAMMKGEPYAVDPRGLIETGQGCVTLPSGRVLYYPDLREEWNEDDQKLEVLYGHGRNKSRIYGPLFDENLVQAIARDVILYHALRIQRLTSKLPSLMVHDELVYVVPIDTAETFLQTVLSVMRKPPKWLPGIVLWSEGDMAERYGLAK